MSGAIVPTPNKGFGAMTGEIMLIPQPEHVEKPPTGTSAEDLEAKLRWINEKVPLKEENVMGSQAGAGSGDFHQYRMARRREQFRWARVEKEDIANREREEFEQRKRAYAAECESKTDKNRAKRQKKKAKQQAKKQQQPAGGEGGAGTSTAGGGGKGGTGDASDDDDQRGPELD